MIIAGAIKFNNKIYLGRGHSDIIFNIRIKYKDCKLKILPQDQGFYTNDKRFLSREEALEHAIECKQVKRESVYSVFTSEDIWNQLDPEFKIVEEQE